MKKIFVLFLFGFLFSACGGSYFAKATLVKSSNKKDILAAITSVLQNSGYTVEMANTAIGIINTAWKEKNKFMYRERTKMSFSVDFSQNMIRMTPARQMKSNMKKDEWGEVRIKQNDEYFNSILLKIATMLNNKVKVVWVKVDD